MPRMYLTIFYDELRRMLDPEVPPLSEVCFFPHVLTAPDPRQVFSPMRLVSICYPSHSTLASPTREMLRATSSVLAFPTKLAKAITAQEFYSLLPVVCGEGRWPFSVTMVLQRWAPPLFFFFFSPGGTEIGGFPPFFICTQGAPLSAVFW